MPASLAHIQLIYLVSTHRIRRRWVHLTWAFQLPTLLTLINHLACSHSLINKGSGAGPRGPAKRVPRSKPSRRPLSTTLFCWLGCRCWCLCCTSWTTFCCRFSSPRSFNAAAADGYAARKAGGWPRILAIVVALLWLIGGVVGAIRCIWQPNTGPAGELPTHSEESWWCIFDQSQQWPHDRFGMRPMSKDEIIDSSLKFGQEARPGASWAPRSAPRRRTQRDDAGAHLHFLLSVLPRPHAAVYVPLCGAGQAHAPCCIPWTTFRRWCRPTSRAC